MGGLTQDGYSDFFNFSTGRRNVTSLHAVFALVPRHDFVQWIYQTLRTFVDLQYRPTDELQLDFRLPAGALPHDFVWCLVAKEELLTVKDGRWDLVIAHCSDCDLPSYFFLSQTFTKTSENPLLPGALSVMSGTVNLHLPCLQISDHSSRVC
jgi:hypothetical protein